MESPVAMQDPPLMLDQEEVLFPCKGCGDILEEGKAFELAGNRWHIDCFRCNTCNTLLDSDANLLLLGDGSLICNNCTYSCTACGNKIEDLAILTGDQAFCANCFKCRNCKRKIENLRYARTSQGIFCMQCHESLMARRRKKNRGAPVRTTSSTSNGSGGPVVLDKSLPALPAHIMSDGAGGTESAVPAEKSPRGTQPDPALPSRTSPGTQSSLLTSPADTASPNVDEDFFIPVGLDPSPAPPAATQTQQSSSRKASRDAATDQSRQDYFTAPAQRSGVTSSPPYQDAFSDFVSGADRSASADPQHSRSRGSPNVPAQAPSPPVQLSQTILTSPHPTGFQESNQKDRFRLQDAPKTRAGGSPVISSSQDNSPNLNLNSRATTSPVLDPIAFSGDRAVSSELGQTPKPKSTTKTAPISTARGDAHAFERPARDDSMRPPPPKQTPISRKEAPPVDPDLLVDSAGRPVERAGSNLATIGRQDPNKGQPVNKHLAAAAGPMDALPSRSPRRPITATREENDAQDAETGTPPPIASVAENQRSRFNDSVSSTQGDDMYLKEPSTPQFGDGAMDTDMDQLHGDELDQLGLFRKMSKAMRHGRSQSDKIGASSPKWPRTARNMSVDISSPITPTTDPKEENVELRNKVRYAQQRIAELEAEKLALQEKVNGTVDIRQVNTELREKRSTMAILDTQREMVVRELEVMTEQLHKAKETNAPLDMNQIQNDVMREFAASVAKLKDSLRTQIEDLIGKKNELTNEISTLIQMKDKGFQEYESLSTRNVQLSEVNNQLVHQIQEMYKQGKQPGVLPSNGLGIYTNHKSDASVDHKSSVAGESQLSGDTEVEPATVLTAPQVVNIRKGQPKKFNWKKGGQTVAKNVSKGFRGAFGSNQNNGPLRDDHFEEGLPYSSLPTTGEAPITGTTPLAPSRMGSDQGRQAWGLLGQKEKALGTTGLSAPREGLGFSSSSTSLAPPDAATTLFGSDLTARCEFEKRIIPTLVMSCVSEVSLRGLHAEGIYRKSGSSSQVKAIQVGFEKDPFGYGISDPDLDIHAVTGVLKQYFRRLPNPLITFEAYDYLLEAANAETEKEVKVSRMREVVSILPKCHRETLEFLMSHLVQVTECNEDNLMSALNIAVVFAPTIMRPASVEREMTDMQSQRNAIQCLLENYAAIFGTNE